MESTGVGDSEVQDMPSSSSRDNKNKKNNNNSSSSSVDDNNNTTATTTTTTTTSTSNGDNTSNNSNGNNNSANNKKGRLHFESFEAFLQTRAAYLDNMYNAWFKAVEEGGLREGVEALRSMRHVENMKTRYEGK